MTAEKSLIKLQNQLNKLAKENLKLKDELDLQREKNKSLQNQLRYIEKIMEDKIKKVIAKTTQDLLDENLKENEIIDIAEGFMDGDIDMFPLKDKGIVQKNEQIWKQLSAYINENYIFEESQMELFD